MRSGLISISLATVILAAGCFGATTSGPSAEPAEQPPAAKPWVNVRPTLTVAGPGDLMVGEALTILGQGFVDRVHGKVVLQFKGTFFNSQGSTSQVDYQSAATVVNGGKLRWEMWPNVVFDERGDRLGRFVGHVIAINQGNDGTLEASDPLPATINVKPSLIVRVARPLDSSCNSMVGHTLENTQMGFMVEAIGFRNGTADAPLTFYWSFLSSQWQVSFDNGAITANPSFSKAPSFTIEEQVTSGASSVIVPYPAAVPGWFPGWSKKIATFAVKMAEDAAGNSRLKDLRTNKIPDAGNNMPISVNVAVVDASGKSAALAVKFIVHRPADLLYDGGSKVAERFEPVPLTDCMPGGDLGREVSYHDSKSESRQRALGFSYNANAAMNFGLPSNPFALGLNFSAGFGVNVNESISSDKSQSVTLQGHILPGEYAMFYRQTTKIVRVAKLVGYSVCGQSVNLGDAILTDWVFTPELAKGETCPVPSSLPAAGKYL
ncbi:MAG: hypothetical protein IT371_25160 [Deltaproteobacteria bacterium]|nr:hypothetical protein [Deltaproteobacteria bacterium]